MTSEEEKVLEAIRKPRTNIEIVSATGLSWKEVSKVIRKLKRKELVISRGMTAARRHMTLAAAIDVLFEEVGHLAHKAGIKTTRPSWF